MIRYRQEALDQASARDPLDQPLPLLRPGWWGVLTALLLVSGGALVWGVLGRVPGLAPARRRPDDAARGRASPPPRPVWNGRG